MKSTDHLQKQLSSTRRLSGTLSATHGYLRHQLWVWPIIAGLVLAAVGWWVHRSVEEAMRDRLAAIPGVTVRDLGVAKCGIVTFTKDGVAPDAIKAAMAGQKINVSASRRSSTLLDMTARRLDAVVRSSVHYYNSEAELDRFARALGELR